MPVIYDDPNTRGPSTPSAPSSSEPQTKKKPREKLSLPRTSNAPPSQPTIQQFADKRGFDPFLDKPRVDAALQHENPYSFQQQVSKHTEMQAQFNSIQDRIDRIEASSGERLPTDLTLAIAESRLDGRDLHRVGRLLARELNTPLANVFPQAQKSPLKSVFVNPVTNKPLTLAAARRLYKPYERQFYENLITSKKIDPGDVAAWFRALAPVGEGLSWEEAVGMAFGLADKMGTHRIDYFSQNLQVLASGQNMVNPATGKPMSEKDKVTVAFKVSQQSIAFKNQNDVVTFLLGSDIGPEPEAGTPAHKAWAERQATWAAWNQSKDDASLLLDLRKGRESDTWRTQYTYRVQQQQGKYTGNLTQQELLDAAASDADKYVEGRLATLEAQLAESPDMAQAVALQEGGVDDTLDYNKMVEEIKTNYFQNKENHDNQLLNQVFHPVGKFFDITSDLINTTLWTAGTGLGIGLRLAASPITHESFGHISTDAQHYMDIGHRMLFSEHEGGDNYGLAIAMIDELERQGKAPGVPWHILANATEFGAQIALDPTNFLFGIGKFQRAARMVHAAEGVDEAIDGMRGWEKVMRQVAGGSDTLLAPTFEGRVAEFLSTPMRKLGGQKVPEWMISTARKYAEKPEDFYDAVAWKFKSPLSGEGVPPQVVDAIHQWVGVADAHKIRTTQQLEDDVTDILSATYDIVSNRVDHPKGLAEILAGITEGRRYGLTEFEWARNAPMASTIAPHFQPWMTDERAVKAAEDVARRMWNYWEAKPGAVTSMAIPQIRGLSSDARVAIHKRLMQSWFGDGIRYRQSIITSMAANLEEDFPGWMKNYMARSKGLFSRNEVARWSREAAAIADPFSNSRESRFIKILEDLQEEVERRIAKKHGLSDFEVKHFLEDTRKRTHDLNRHLYGITDQNVEDWNKVMAGDYQSLRNPQFVTQLPNLWMTTDPVRLEKLIEEGLGYRKRMVDMFGRVFGKEVSDDVRNVLTGQPSKLKRATANHLVNSFIQNNVRDRLMRYWKTGVVATPRYLFRVPMGDEQLRFVADAGVLGWAGSRKYVANIAEKLGHTDDFIEYDVRSADYVSRLNAEAVDAGFVHFQDALEAEALRRAGGITDAKVQLLDGLDPDAHKVVVDTIDTMEARGLDPRKGLTAFLHDENAKIKIHLPRPGELLDEQAVNAQRATSVFVSHEGEAKRMLERMRQFSNQNEKFWDEIMPTDPGYTRSLTDVLVNQVGRDPVGGRILRRIAQGWDSDEIQRELVRYMARDEWGRNVAQRLHLVSRADLEGHAEKVERMVREWTMGDEALASAALKGDAGLIGRIVDQWVATDPEALHAVHGFKAAQVLDRSYPGKFLWDTYTRAIFELPTNKLSRQPFFKHWYTTFREGLLNVAKDKGMDMTPELLRKIEAQARFHAVERTKAIMFDFRRESRFGEMLWFVAPFYQPWTEAFLVWGKLLRKNPQFANRARIFYSEAERMGWIRGDPVTGEKQVPMSNLWFMAPLLNMAYGGFGGNGFGLSGPLNSFNFVFGSQFELPTGKLAGNVPLPVPSLNPSLMVFGQQIARSDMVPDPLKYSFMRWAFQYGDQSQNYVGSLLPSYLQHAIRGAKSLPGAGLPIVKSVIETAQEAVGGQDVLKSQADDFLRLYEAQGMTPQNLAADPELAKEMTGQKFKSVEEAQQYLADKAMHQAEQLSEWRSVMSMFFPAAPSLSFPTQELELEYRRYVEQYGYDKGRDKFLEDYPDNALITIPTTYWNRPDSRVPLPANELADRILSQPGVKQFVKDYPTWAFAMLPNEVWGEQFDRGLFFQQMANGDRSTRGPLDMFNAADAQAGWQLYTDAKLQHLQDQENLKAQNISESDPAFQALDVKYDEYVDAVKTLYPGFADKINTFDISNLDPWVESGVDKALKSDLFKQTQVGQFLIAYRGLRTQIMGRMQELGLHTLKTVSAETYGVKQEYESGVKALIKQFGPDAERTYNYFFRNDLQAVQTKGDRLLSKLANDPQAYEQYLGWAKEWGDAQLQAANSSNESQVINAYFQMRQMSTFAFDTYGKGPQNPQMIWWNTRTEAEKDSYTASVKGRPYVFLSRFDRQTVLGEKTTDSAEEAWLQVGRYDALIARVKADDPNASTVGFYRARDAMVAQLIRKDKVFAQQVAHANVWGYSFFADGTLEAMPGREGEAWHAFRQSLETIQSFVIANELHGETDFGVAREVYRETRSRLLSLVEYLKDYSPDFESQWERMETAVPGPDLLSDFMPDTWFKLGGY